MSVDLFSKFAIDPTKIANGVWIDLSDMEGVPGSIKIGKYGSPAYNDSLKTHALELKQKSGNSQLTEEDWDLVTQMAAADSLILDWRDITLNGEPVEYSFELALKLLQMEEMDGFRQFVQSQSMNNANWALEDAEVLSKKL